MQYVSIMVNQEPSDGISTAKHLLQISTCKVLRMTQLLVYCVVAQFCTALVHTSLFVMANVLYGERYINHSGAILAVCVSLAAQSFSHAYIMSR